MWIYLLIWWKDNFGTVAPESTKVAVRVLSIPTPSTAISKVTNVGEDIDDSDDDNNDDTVDDSDDNVDNVDNSDINSDDGNGLSVNI
nr:12439_t:CDS:2 [Entrophospora candida]